MLADPGWQSAAVVVQTADDPERVAARSGVPILEHCEREIVPVAQRFCELRLTAPLILWRAREDKLRTLCSKR
jgi:hypothetical protein